MTADDVMAAIRANDKTNYTYVLRRPSGEPFYVGVGRGNRVLHHARDARVAKNDGYKLRIIRSIWRDGLDIDYEVADFFETFGQALQAEVELIREHGRFDKGAGPLANHTDGGEGVAGRIVTDAMREATRRAHTGAKRGPETRARLSELQKNKFKNPAFVANLSKKVTEFWSSDEARKAASKRTKDAWLVPGMREKIRSSQDYTSPERRAKNSTSAKTAMERPGAKENLSAKSSANWNDPEYRERHSAALAIAMNRPGVREKISESSKKSWSDPALRAHMSEKTKSAWRSPEHRSAMMAAQRRVLDAQAAGLIPRKPKPALSDETKALIRSANIGKKQSAETIEKRAAALRGRARPPEVAARAAAARAANAKPKAPKPQKRLLTTEERSSAAKARAEAKRAQGAWLLPHHKNKTPEGRAKHRRPVEINGVVYAGSDMAAEALDVGRTTIKRWLKAGTHGARRL